MSDSLQEKINSVNQKTKELNALYHVAASRSGVPDSEVAIWSVLLDSGEEYSQRDLALLLSLPVQTVNSIVSNMVKRGHVELDHSPGTRNRKTVRVTDSGRAYVDEKLMWIFEAERNAVKQTNPDDIDKLVELMDDYISCLRGELRLGE